MTGRTVFVVCDANGVCLVVFELELDANKYAATIGACYVSEHRIQKKIC